jgi:hypothetical protein
LIPNLKIAFARLARETKNETLLADETDAVRKTTHQASLLIRPWLVYPQKRGRCPLKLSEESLFIQIRSRVLVHVGVI